jgi:predicted nucleic acid-binding protein
MSAKENQIVVNTSPWIALSICGQIPLLKKIHNEVYIPFGVKEEILAGGKQGIGVRELKESSWLKIGKVLDIEKEGMISSIKPLIAKILENGIWIKDEIVKGILKDAMEEL